MIDNKKEYDLILTSGMFWELHPELSGNWEKDKNYFMEKAKVINTNNFEGNMKIPQSDLWLNWWNENIEHYLEKQEITLEDENEMWKQIEKNYLESSQE